MTVLNPNSKHHTPARQARSRQPGARNSTQRRPNPVEQFLRQLKERQFIGLPVWIWLGGGLVLVLVTLCAFGRRFDDVRQ